ncbi:MAG: cob(I)yrinic acid a,c-diamide adenosyltransferase [Candidatus Desulforudis sp.]|nr:cob(I)yrinic acid a,c-diamide adenosyltransferase [Desulforudis sp.]
MSDRKGLVLVFTGDGKGKTTAALGLALRAVGHGMRVLVLQFVKGGWETGEIKAAAGLAGLEIRSVGAGFVHPGEEQGLSRHREAAGQALAEARAALQSGLHDLVILDEALCALGLSLVSLEELLTLISLRPPGMHLVLTGRGAPPEIVARADLVTEMREVKHPYHAGIAAQRGIEF